MNSTTEFVVRGRCGGERFYFLNLYHGMKQKESTSTKYIISHYELWCQKIHCSSLSLRVHLPLICTIITTSLKLPASVARFGCTAAQRCPGLDLLLLIIGAKLHHSIIMNGFDLRVSARMPCNLHLSAVSPLLLI